MSRKRKRRSNSGQTVENSLSTMALYLKSLNGTTGGSTLSSYGTVAYSNNYALITLNRILLTYLYANNGIFQTAIQLPIQDAFGKRIELDVPEMSAYDIDLVYEFMEERGIWELLLNVWTWVRLFGGGSPLVNTTQDPSLPLNTKGLYNQPLEFYDIDRWQLDTNVIMFNEVDTALHFDSDYIYLYGEKIHKSRFKLQSGKRAPHYIRRQLRGWGMSEGERMLRDLNLYLKTQDVTYEILDEAKVDVYKIKGLAQKMMLAGGTERITQRVQTANEIKNYVNALVLDSEEGYESKSLSFAGLAEVMQQNRIGVAAALRMPMTKLFGLSASGFNTGESDLENYNAMVESEIRAPSRPMIRWILNIIFANIFGYVPKYKFEFPPLRELAPEQRANVEGVRSNIILSWYERGLIDSQEAMKQAKQDNLFTIETAAEEGDVNPLPPQGDESTEQIDISNTGGRIKNFFKRDK